MPNMQIQQPICPADVRRTGTASHQQHAHRGRALVHRLCGLPRRGSNQGSQRSPQLPSGNPALLASAICTACSAEMNRSFQHPLVRLSPARPGSGGSPRHRLRRHSDDRLKKSHPPQNLFFFMLLKYKTTQSDERTFQPSICERSIQERKLPPSF